MRCCSPENTKPLGCPAGGLLGKESGGGVSVPPDISFLKVYVKTVVVEKFLSSH